MSPQCNVLVTGCNGFVGRHLTEYLRSSATKVFGIDFQPHPWAEWIAYDALNIADADRVLLYFDQRRIDEVYHLAAVANPRTAQNDPISALRTNVLGSSSFFEACRKYDFRLLVVGTSEEYERGSEDYLELSEDSPLAASSFYSMTKICAEMAGLCYVRDFGCPIIFTRTFNHSGPGQPPVFVLSDFAKQCAEIAVGTRDPIVEVGNIDVYRDFLDVADVVRAYTLLMQRGATGSVYNVCSSEGRYLRDLLTTLISLSGKPDVPILSKKYRMRPGEPISIRGNSGKLRATTGWVPVVEPRQMLTRLFEFWKAQM